MRELVIVGRPNSGKTMFALNFAGYLGCKSVDVTFRTYDDLITCQHFTIDNAKRELCSISTHKTRNLQSLILKLPIGKTTVNFKLTDTCGISEQIHSDEAIRRGMAQTLHIMRQADFILHIIDASLATRDYVANLNNIDREIYNYGIARQNYLILANKMDLLPLAKENFPRLTNMYAKSIIIPVSAMYSTGFKEVKSFVARNI